MQEQTIDFQETALTHGNEDLLAELPQDCREQESLLLDQLETKPEAETLITNLNSKSCAQQEVDSMLLTNIFNYEKIVQQRILEALRLRNVGEKTIEARLEEDNPQTSINIENNRNSLQSNIQLTPAQLCEIVGYIKFQTAIQSNQDQALQSLITDQLPIQEKEKQNGDNQHLSELNQHKIQQRNLQNNHEEIEQTCYLPGVDQRDVLELNNKPEAKFHQVQQNDQRNEIIQRPEKMTKKSLPCYTQYSLNSDNFSAILQEIKSTSDVQERVENQIIQLNEVDAPIEQKIEDKKIQYMQIEGEQNLQVSLPCVSFIQNQQNNASLEVNINSDSKYNMIQERNELSMFIQEKENGQQEKSELDNIIIIGSPQKQLNSIIQLDPYLSIQMPQNLSIEMPKNELCQVSQSKVIEQHIQSFEVQPVEMPSNQIQQSSTPKIVEQRLQMNRAQSQKIAFEQQQNQICTVQRPQYQSPYEYQNLDQPQYRNEILDDGRKLKFQKELNEPMSLVLAAENIQFVQQNNQGFTKVTQQHAEHYPVKQIAQTRYPLQFQPLVLKGENQCFQQHISQISTRLEVEDYNKHQELQLNQNIIEIQQQDSAHEQSLREIPPQCQYIQSARKSLFKDQKCSDIRLDQRLSQKKEKLSQHLTKDQIIIGNQTNLNLSNQYCKKSHKQSQTHIKPQQQTSLDFSRMPPCISININRDNEISLNIFNQNFPNGYNRSKLDRFCSAQSKIESRETKLQKNPEVGLPSTNFSLQEKGIQTVVNRISVSTQTQQYQPKVQQKTPNKQIVAEQFFIQKSLDEELNQIGLMADNYLMFNLLQQHTHKNFQNMLRPHVALKMTPQPISEVGEQLFKNGLIVAAIVKLIARSSKSPFLENYIFEYIQSAFAIQSNSYIFSKECSRAKENFSNYLEVKYQQSYNQMRNQEQKAVKRSKFEQSDPKISQNQMPSKKLKIQSNNFFVSQHNIDKVAKTEKKIFCHQYTEMINSRQHTPTQPLQNRKNSKVQKQILQPKIPQIQQIIKQKQQEISKPIQEKNVQVPKGEDLNETKVVVILDGNTQTSSEDKIQKPEATSKAKYADLKLTSQQKTQCIKQVQTCLQNKNSKFNELYEKYKKIRENKNGKLPTDGNSTPLPKSVLIDSREKDKQKDKQQGGQKKKKHVQFLEQTVQMRKQEPDLSAQEEGGPSKLRKRKKTKKIDNYVDQQDQAIKAKKSTSKK